MREVKKQEVAEWKGEGVKLECFSTIATTNSVDLESLCLVEISFKKPFQRPPQGINTVLVFGVSLSFSLSLFQSFALLCVHVCVHHITGCMFACVYTIYAFGVDMPM